MEEAVAVVYFCHQTKIQSLFLTRRVQPHTQLNTTIAPERRRKLLLNQSTSAWGHLCFEQDHTHELATCKPSHIRVETATTHRKDASLRSSRRSFLDEHDACSSDSFRRQLRRLRICQHQSSQRGAKGKLPFFCANYIAPQV